MRSHDDSPGELLGLENVLPVENRLDVVSDVFRGPTHNRVQLFPGRVGNNDLEEKAVKLGFGKRIGSLLLDRVLGGHDKKGRDQVTRDPPHRHRSLLHRLQQRRLALGRGPVDFIGEDELVENRSGTELERAMTGCLIFHHHVRSRDIRRHEIGRKLNAGKRQGQYPPQSGNQQRLAQARHAFEKDVPVGEQRCKREIHDLLVADDDLRDFVLKSGEHLPERCAGGLRRLDIVEHQIEIGQLKRIRHRHRPSSRQCRIPARDALRRVAWK